jgi:glutamate-1-semialdehyde aminotransferase
LGYGHETVDSAVHDVVTKGNMSTFNCPEEVLLAEKLVEMHPWSDMVKLARTGGEANAVAIRLARAASGRNGVAFCGYHGWHDWYLAANLQNQGNLDSHLLSGLDTKGVPHQLSGTMFPFQYNNFEQLECIISKEKIGVIFMEVMRNYYPADTFLQRVRDIASKNGIVLVFDECTSGFRESYGGLHLKYGVEPDLATFGKALGNGYAITAIIGRESIMRESQNTFISSTFWTERIGPTAALATLKVMDEIKSWDLITNIGNEVRKKLALLAVEHKLEMEILGLPSMLNYKILDKNWPVIKTYITQEMLKYNYLASNSIYSSISHAPNIIDDFFEKLYNIFKIIGKYKMNNEDFPSSLLDDEVSQSGFTRVN